MSVGIRFLLLRGNALALRRCDRVIAVSGSIKEFLVGLGVGRAPTRKPWRRASRATAPRASGWGCSGGWLPTWGIAAHVRFPGWLANPYPVIATKDVVVLTSFAEGFGPVLLEALALGRPVVATAVGAVGEIVRDGVTGLFVTGGDATALAGAITRLLQEPALCREFGARGKETARTGFSPEVMRDRVEAVYISALFPVFPDRRRCSGGPGTT